MDSCEHGMNIQVPYNTVNLISCGTTTFSRMILFCGVEQFIHTISARLDSGSKLHCMFSFSCRYKLLFHLLVVVTADSCTFAKYEKSERTCMCTLTTCKLTVQPSRGV